jgi:hypothetical protein
VVFFCICICICITGSEDQRFVGLIGYITGGDQRFVSLIGFGNFRSEET